MSGKMTEEQKKIVREIVKQAKELGIDPEFAVSLANLESNFSHVPAKVKDGEPPSTAFGPFQVNKATAAANNVDYNEMVKSPELAVRTGLINLVRHAKNPDLMSINPDTGQKEIDTARIIAAHRMGENSEFARTGDTKKIDPVLRGYLNDVSQHFPDQVFPTSVYVTPKEADVEQMPQQVIEDQERPVGEISPTTQQTLTSGLGYKAGLATGVAKVGGAKAVKKVYDYVHDAASNQGQPKTPTHGGENWVKSLTGVDVPGGQMQKSDLDLGKGMQAAVGRNGEPGFTGGKVTEGGILISPQTADQIDKASVQKPKNLAANIFALLEHGSPQQKELAQKVWSNINPKVKNAAQDVWARAKNIPTIGGFGSMGMGAGMAVPSAVSEYAKGNYDAALGNLGLGTAFGAGMAMAPRAAPIVGSGLSALDIGSRIADKDYTGAAISGAGVLGPLAAGALLAPPVGIPVAIGASFVPAAINAYRDYRGSSLPKKTAGGGRGFVNPELVNP